MIGRKTLLTGTLAGTLTLAGCHYGNAPETKPYPNPAGPICAIADVGIWKGPCPIGVLKISCTPQPSTAPERCVFGWGPMMVNGVPVYRWFVYPAWLVRPTDTVLVP